MRALAEEWAPAAESLSRLRQLRAMQPQKNGGNESGLDGISAVIPADGVLENRIGHAAFENGAGHAVLENGRIDAYNGSAEERSSRHDSHKGMGRDFGVVDSPIRGAPSASKGSGGDPWASPYEADVGAEHAQSPFTTSRSIIVARDTASVRPVWNLGAEQGDRLEEHGFMGQDQLSASQLRAAASEVSSNPYRGGSRMGGSAGEDSRDLVSELIWENSSLLRRVEVQANALIEMSVEKEKWITEKAMVDSKQKQAEGDTFPLILLCSRSEFAIHVERCKPPMSVELSEISFLQSCEIK